MKKLFKMDEFESPTGWHVSAFNCVGPNQNYWFWPARVLGISVPEFVHLLIKEYHIIPISYTIYDNGWQPLFLWHWPNYQTAHSFLLRINREARNKHFYVEVG